MAMKQFLKGQMLIKHPAQTPFKNRPKCCTCSLQFSAGKYSQIQITRSVEMLPSSPINPTNWVCCNVASPKSNMKCVLL